MKRCFLISVGCLCLVMSLLSQTVEDEPLALRINDPVTIDGRLNEPFWENAPEANVYLYQQSERDNPEMVRTLVKILYDDNSVYLGFSCFDSQPHLILVETTERDADIRDDDSLYVLIATEHNLNNFYYFGTNLLGTQFDGITSRDGLTVNQDWDSQWSCAAQKTDSGWSAEFALDLSQLEYQPQENVVLKLGLSRVVPRLDSVFRKGWLDPAFDFDQVGALHQLELIRSFQRMEFTSHFINVSEAGEKSSPGGGLDFEYAFSSQTSGRVVVNPDFASVEPDLEQVNLTVYELYLPEKRDFFAPSAQFFRQPLGLVYSKRIGDIYVGVTAQGKSGAWEYSGLSVQSKKDEDLNIDSANHSALRLKSRWLKDSTLGITAGNKWISGKNFGTAGIDTEINFTGSFRLAGQFALSYGDYNKNNIAFFLSPSYDSESFHAHLIFSRLDKHFGDNVNHVGFIPDDNRQELDSRISKTFFFEKGGMERIRYDSNYNIYWGTDGTLRSWQIDEGVWLVLKSKWYFLFQHSREYKLNEDIRGPVMVPGYEDLEDPTSYVHSVPKYFKHFRNYRTKVISGMDKGEGSRFSLEFTMGKNFDLDFQLMRMRKSFRISQVTFANFDFYGLRYQGNNEPMFQSTTILVIDITHYLTQNLYIKSFVQTNSAIKKRNFQFYCTYLFKPPYGSVQLAFQRGTAPFGLAGTQGNTFLLKLIYGF